MKPGYFESSAALYLLMIAAYFVFVPGRYDTFSVFFGEGLAIIGDTFIVLSEYSRSEAVK